MPRRRAHRGPDRGRSCRDSRYVDAVHQHLGASGGGSGHRRPHLLGDGERRRIEPAGEAVRPPRRRVVRVPGVVLRRDGDWSPIGGHRTGEETGGGGRYR